MEAQQATFTGGMQRGAGQGMALSEAQLQQLKEYYGLDKPWYESYVLWLGKVATGDLGTSYRYNEPVWDVIRDRLPGQPVLRSGQPGDHLSGLYSTGSDEGHRSSQHHGQSDLDHRLRRLRGARLCARRSASAVFLGGERLVSHGRVHQL